MTWIKGAKAPTLDRAALAPRPDNDRGAPPRGASRLVLMACTGSRGEHLSLDILLRTTQGDVVLATRLPQPEAIAQARLLAACHGVALAMLSLAGEPVPLEGARSSERRRGFSVIAKRRPRFLHRRKAGIVFSAA